VDYQNSLWICEAGPLAGLKIPLLTKISSNINEIDAEEEILRALLGELPVSDEDRSNFENLLSEFKEVSSYWTSEQQRAYDDIKQRVVATFSFFVPTSLPFADYFCYILLQKNFCFEHFINFCSQFLILQMENSKCNSCHALFKKLTDLNSRAELREEELSSKLAVDNLQIDALTREIISLRHQLNRPVLQSVEIQTDYSCGVSMKIQTQTEAILFAHSEIFPALASFRATQNVRIGTSAFPGNKISDYVPPPPPVNIADLEY